MTVLGKIRAISLTVAFAVIASLGPASAGAQSPAYMKLSANDMVDSRPVYLGIDKSVVIDLPRPAGDVLVSNPQIADAVLRTSSRLYLIGVKLGQASVFLFDGTGAQIASFDVYVEADLGSLNQLLAEAIPNGYVRAEAIQGSIVLRGQVPSASDASKAVQITQSMIERSPISTSSGASSGTAASTSATSSTSTFAAGSGPGIVNLLSITGEDQVALKVRIAEVQREVTKQLGINIGGTTTGDKFSVGTNIAGASGGVSPIINPGGGAIGATLTGSDFNISAILQALDETKMIRTLAEPTLTAVSGETADFLAGGEFGYQVVEPSGGNTLLTTVAFKPFGVELAFTPVVLSAGRISIRVRTSVSEIAGTTNGIPSLTTRRAETTVEQPSGGSFVIGGLLQQDTSREVSGFPGLQRLPVLGALFSSRKYLDRETELVIIVTPYLVKPVSPNALASPGDNLALTGDAEAHFLNRLTKVYGTESQVPGRQVGFSFE